MTPLFVSGALHEGAETIYLLSPDEPGFWRHVTAQPEFADGRADPLDRWSERVIGALAAEMGGRALFPFGGAPFYDWALRSGQFFAAPVRLLVHPRMGLWASFRGAVAVPGHRPLPAPAASPCDGCPAPCAAACPALTRAGYDLALCHDFLSQADCLSMGCAVRYACPVGLGYGRLPEQSAWHMRQFTNDTRRIPPPDPHAPRQIELG
ncbi:ferredoxin [Paenirhodobacter sp.]|uniref:ferredoxin n=1 Tax=Paenirhodobacter sp. TaxID=1965326 RepID=UPI003B3DCB01